MRYILVSTEDSTVRKPLEVPDAIVSGRPQNKIKKPIKRNRTDQKTVQKTIQKSKAIIQNVPVHNNNKRRSKPM